MKRIDRPIIVVGTGRCGSTIVFEALSRHADVGWFSNYCNRYPRVGFAPLVSRMYDLPLLRGIPRGEKTQHKQGSMRFNRYMPKPDESYEKWEYLCGSKFRDTYLIGVRATQTEKWRVEKAVRQILFWQGKSRFAAKITGPSRIEFLHSIFPDLLIVDVVRDGRAVVNSLLNYDTWKEAGAFEKPKWTGGLPEDWEQEWRSYGSTTMALAAIQYRTIMEVTQRERAMLGPNQYLRIRYEDYIRDPAKVIDQMLVFCGLGPCDAVTNYVTESGRYANMNTKFLQRFSAEELEILDRILGKWLDPYR